MLIHVRWSQTSPHTHTHALFYLVTDSNLTKWHDMKVHRKQKCTTEFFHVRLHPLTLAEHYRNQLLDVSIFTQCISAVATVMNQTTPILGSPEYIDKFGIVFMKRGSITFIFFFLLSSNLVRWASLGLPAQDMLCMNEYLSNF